MERGTCNTSRVNSPGMADVADVPVLVPMSGGLIKRCHGGSDIMQRMSER